MNSRNMDIFNTQAGRLNYIAVHRIFMSDRYKNACRHTERMKVTLILNKVFTKLDHTLDTVYL
jgi:hypothetical protein